MPLLTLNAKFALSKTAVWAGSSNPLDETKTRGPGFYYRTKKAKYHFMLMRSITANPSQVMVDQLAAVVLDGIDSVKLAEGVGIEGRHVQEESHLAAAIEHGLNVVEGQNRPFLLNIRLSLGLTEGGRAAAQFRLADAMSTA